MSLARIISGGSSALRRLAGDPVPDPVERRLGGIAGGTLWIFGGLLLGVLTLFTSQTSHHRPVVLALAGAGVAWGIACVAVIDWNRASASLSHASGLAGIVGAGVATWATGGTSSPAGVFIAWLALYACYFYVVNVAIAYMLVCIVVQSLPLFYDSGTALHVGFISALGAFVAGEISIGGALIAGNALQAGRRRRAEMDAFSDSLTGLANRRMLATRLTEETRAVARDGALLAVVVLDIDHFKQINDSGGHAEGDRALVFVARCLSQAARREDLLTRSGGDEFTWLMPGLDAVEAKVRLERARALIEIPRETELSISAGVADSTQAADLSRLVQLADSALYWAKAHGRARSQIYDPADIATLSADERADKLQRSQALSGLRTLAQAMDAKSPRTRGHSERVAALAVRLARAAGWEESRAALLSEAGLLHDLGKIGVEEAVLRKPEPLSSAEAAQLRAHPQLSARIVDGILGPEQVHWIQAIGERPDGAGYPHGLRENEIPDGACLLALADRFDEMMACSGGFSLDSALAECRAGAGERFSAAAVAALERMLGTHELSPADAAALECQAAVLGDIAPSSS